jgi:hypothetical protein
MSRQPSQLDFVHVALVCQMPTKNGGPTSRSGKANSPMSPIFHYCFPFFRKTTWEFAAQTITAREKVEPQPLLKAPSLALVVQSERQSTLPNGSGARHHLWAAIGDP